MADDDTPYDASDERQVKLADRQDRKERQRDKEELLWLLADRRGRRFLWRLLEQAGVFRSSFAGTSAIDVNAVVSSEGRRSVGLAVLGDVLATDPAAYLAMIQENRSTDV